MYISLQAIKGGWCHSLGLWFYWLDQKDGQSRQQFL